MSQSDAEFRKRIHAMLRAQASAVEKPQQINVDMVATPSTGGSKLPMDASVAEFVEVLKKPKRTRKPSAFNMKVKEYMKKHKGASLAEAAKAVSKK